MDIRCSRHIAGLGLALLSLILAACSRPATHQTNSVKPVKTIQAGDTICDAFLASMPPPGPERVEAGKPCKEALPSLTAKDQLRIANYYAAQLPNFIPKDEYADLITKLDENAALPFRALNMRYVIQGDYKSEMAAAKQLVREAEEADNDVALVNAIFAELLVSIVVSRVDEFNDERMEAALTLAARENMGGQEPYLRNLWALAQNSRGENAASIKNYQAARRGFEANQNYAGMSMALVNLSYLYSEFQDTDQAVDFAQQALDTLDENSIEAPNKRASAMIALGEHLSAAQRYEQAIEIFNTIIDYSESENIPILDETLMAQFRAIHKSGDPQAAIKLAVERFKSGHFPKDSFARLELSAWLGARQAELGDAEEAKYLFDYIVDFTDGPEGDLPYLKRFISNAGSEHSKLIIGQDLLLTAIAAGKEQDAIEIAKVLEDVRKDHVKSAKVKAIAGHELQTRIDALGLEAERNALALQSSKLRFALAALSALALAIIAFIAFVSFRTQKQLTATQERLTEQKNTYLDEIHHRTKNNFQVLSSILNMDIRRSDAVDKTGGRRLDAINRLQTMALVHDHIYSLDASKESTADLGEFIDDLLALLDTSLGRDDVTLEWSVHGGQMDVGRLTPFGLLICELITNSYKHAFAESGGTITIDIVEEDGTNKMTLKDDGQGFDLEAAKAKTGSLGMDLIFDLADQVGGKLSVESGPDGTVWTLK